MSAVKNIKQAQIHWNDLQKEITCCQKCPRLVEFREEIGRTRRKQYRNFDYWARPVPSIGSLNARLMIVGLAPAAHGGNRTGRMFTGDQSARFLFEHLYKAGFSNQSKSEDRSDGLKLIDCYITAVVHCVPPDNKPTPQEIRNCSGFLERESELMNPPKAILALGRVAFAAITDYAKRKYGITKRFEFAHGVCSYVSASFPLVYASYHPSPRNTQTGKLTSAMFAAVLRNIRKTIYSSK